jgi:hypothetical protein
LYSNNCQYNPLREILHSLLQANPYKGKQPLLENVYSNGAKKAPQEINFITTLVVAMPAKVPFALPGRNQSLNAARSCKGWT